MPTSDISLCTSETCPSRALCYRSTAVPSDWQSYIRFEPEAGEDRCKNFITNKQSTVRTFKESVKEIKKW